MAKRETGWSAVAGYENAALDAFTHYVQSRTTDELSTTELLLARDYATLHGKRVAINILNAALRERARLMVAEAVL